MERSTRHRRISNKKKNILQDIVLVFFISVITCISLLPFISRDYIFASENAESSNVSLIDIIYGQSSFDIFSHPKVVTIANGEKEIKLLTTSSTVQEVLEEIEYKLEDNQYTNPKVEEQVLTDSKIIIHTTHTKLATTYVEVPFKTVVEYSDEVPAGEKIIEHTGSKGKKEIITEKFYLDNIKQVEKVVSEKLVIHPQDRIEVIGKVKQGIQDCAVWDKVINMYVPKDKYKTKNTWMRYIMRKETGCDSGQNTRNKYFGLYQFVPNTFRGYGGVDIYDGEDQIRIASKMYDACAQGQWGASYRSAPYRKSFQTEFPILYNEIERKCGR